MADGFIVDVGGQRMQTYGESLVLLVGNEIDFGVVKLAHQSAGVLQAMHLFASDLGHGGFSPVSDEFDGVDEVFFLQAQLAEALVFGEVLNRDVLVERLAFGFEFLDLQAAALDGVLEFSLFAFSGFDLLGGEIGGQMDVAKVAKLAAEQGALRAQLAVEVGASRG
jgi:hypothetical protein